MKNRYYSYIQVVRSLFKIEPICATDFGRHYETIYDGSCVGIHDTVFP